MSTDADRTDDAPAECDLCGGLLIVIGAEDLGDVGTCYYHCSNPYCDHV